MLGGGALSGGGRRGVHLLLLWLGHWAGLFRYCLLAFGLSSQIIAFGLYLSLSRSFETQRRIGLVVAAFLCETYSVCRFVSERIGVVDVSRVCACVSVCKCVWVDLSIIDYIIKMNGLYLAVPLIHSLSLPLSFLTGLTVSELIRSSRICV